MRFIPLFLIVPLALAGCARTPAQVQAEARAADSDRIALERELAGLVPDGSPGCLNAIDSRNARSIKAYGPAIVYRISPRVKYVTTTSGGCERIARGDTLITVSPNSQLCRGDIARTVDLPQHIPTGSCSFGDFVRYKAP